MRYARFGFAAVLLGTLLLASGCPRPELPDLPDLVIDPSGDTGNINIGNDGGGNLRWSVDADVEWISFSEDSGEGEANVEVLIDRSALPPLTISTGHITVSSSGGTETIEVRVPSPIAGLDPAYLPMQVGNIWKFQLPVYEPEPIEELKLTQAVLSALSVEPSVVLELEVTDSVVVNGITAWEVEIRVPDIGIPTPPPVVVEEKEDCGTLPVSPSLKSYWINVDGIWFVTLRQSAVDALPSTTGWIPFVELVKLPGKIIYLVYSGRLETFIQDAMEVVADADAQTEPLQEDLDAFMDSLWVDTDEDGEPDTLDLDPLLSLLNAFGAEFDNYSSDNEVLADVIRLAAALANSVEPLVDFVNSVSDLLDAANEAASNLPDPDDDYDYQAAGVQWLTAFGDAFDAYESADPIIEGVVRLLAEAAKQVAFLEVADDDYTQADYDALEEFNQAIQEYLADEPDTCTPLKDAMDGLLSQDYKLVFGAAGEISLGIEPSDIDELIAFIEDYASGNVAVNNARQTYLALLPMVRDLLIVSETYDLTEFAMADLKAFTVDFAAFASQFAAANPENIDGLRFAIIAAFLDGVADELLVLEPSIEDIVAELEQLLVDLDNPSQSIFDPATYEEAFGDLAAFFEGYDDANDNVVAQIAGIEFRAAEEIAALAVALKAELDAIEYVERQGSLSELLPEFPDALTLEDFGVGEQEDCLSAGVIIPEPPEEGEEPGDTPTHEVTMAIFGNDLGPLMIGPLTLYEATVDGVTVGGE